METVPSAFSAFLFFVEELMVGQRQVPTFGVWFFLLGGER
jgi:hypothetical protein